MALCYKYWRRDPGGFPIFSGGLPLFCNGGLATTCCPKKYYFNCDPEEDEHDGYEEDPCEIPDHWTGGYDIYTVCDIYTVLGCQKGPRPSITVPSGVGGCELDYAVLCEWRLGRISWTITDAEFSGAGTMTVSFNGNSFMSYVFFDKGETKTFYVEIPEDYGDSAFGDSSNVLHIVTRIQLTTPDELFWDVNSYVWCEKYTGNRTPGSIMILPTGIENVEGIMPNGEPTYGRVYAESGVGDPEDYSWRLKLYRLKSGYGSWEEAAAVFDTHYDAIKAYAESCFCDLYSKASCWIICDMPGDYDPDIGMYKLHMFPHEGGCPYILTGPVWWEVENVRVVEGVSIFIQNLETGTYHSWEGGSKAIPPCHMLFFAAYDPDDLPGGEPWASGDAWRISPDNECSTEIECAFCAVPGFTHTANCLEC